jgi:hypothetical protein
MARSWKKIDSKRRDQRSVQRRGGAPKCCTTHCRCWPAPPPPPQDVCFVATGAYSQPPQVSHRHQIPQDHAKLGHHFLFISLCQFRHLKLHVRKWQKFAKFFFGLCSAPLIRVNPSYIFGWGLIFILEAL